MSIIKNNSVIVATCTKRINALKKHIAAKTPILINGVPHTAAQLISAYNACLQTRAAPGQAIKVAGGAHLTSHMHKTYS